MAWGTNWLRQIRCTKQLWTPKHFVRMDEKELYDFLEPTFPGEEKSERKNNGFIESNTQYSGETNLLWRPWQ